MVTFDHENLPKTRRSILIVCVLIIAGESYLSSTISNVGFGGLKFDVTKDQIVSGFCIGLFYLWLVAMAQIATEPLKKSVENWREIKQEKIFKDFDSPHRSRDDSPDEEPNEAPEYLVHRRVVDIAQNLQHGIDSYSTLIFTAPSIALTAFVWIKYNGFFRVFTALTDIIFN